METFNHQPSRPDCEVCRLRPAAGVASSRLGPLSLAYCAECLAHRAEPYWLADATLEQIGGLAHGASWLQQITTYQDGRYLTMQEVEAHRQQHLMKRMTICPPQNQHLFPIRQPTCCNGSTASPRK